MIHYNNIKLLLELSAIPPNDLNLFSVSFLLPFALLTAGVCLAILIPILTVPFATIIHTARDCLNSNRLL
jgi:hypothetical protein